MKKNPSKRTTKPKAKTRMPKSLSPKAALAASLALADRLAETHPKMLLKPINKPGALWVSRINGRKLTSMGALQLSRALNQTGRGIAIDKLLPFAENENEHDLIQFIHSARPNLFAGCSDPLKALFLLRVIHIPTVCRGFLYYESSIKNECVVWLGALSAYSVAFERTLFERLFRAMGHAEFLPNDNEQCEKWFTANFGGSVLNWFEDAPEGYGFWLSRFNQWREYAVRSLNHWFGCQSIDYRKMTGSMKAAAHLGILKLMKALPEDRVAELLNDVNATKQTRMMFCKNSKKRATTPRNLEFESWLIECWPLVLEYGWSYRDLQLVASARFEEDQIKFSLTPDTLKERCQELGLTLGNGSNKIGRVKASEEWLLPRMSQVALKIDGLEDHAEWYWGKADKSLKIFQSIPLQS